MVLLFTTRSFEDFVESGAHVDVSVGEGRSVVEDEFGRVSFAALGDNSLIESFRFPFLEPSGLFFHQVASHRKGRFREEQGLFITGSFSAHSVCRCK